MLICGIFVFKEKLGLHQKIGLGLLLAGLALFFNDKLDVFKGESGYLTGVLLSPDCFISLGGLWYGTKAYAPSF